MRTDTLKKILDVLKEKKVKATFFSLQDYAEKNPELVKRMIDEGHIVGNSFGTPLFYADAWTGGM